MTLPVEGVNLFEQPDWPLEPCAGDTHTDAQGRLWTCYGIGFGAKGGRWAYHINPNRVAVDTRQNLHSAHFAGMLALPWDGLTKLGWVLAKAHCSAVPEKLEIEPPEATRFERLDKPPSQEE